MTKKDAVSTHMASAYQKNLRINHIIRNYSACQLEVLQTTRPMFLKTTNLLKTYYESIIITLTNCVGHKMFTFYQKLLLLPQNDEDSKLTMT